MFERHKYTVVFYVLDILSAVFSCFGRHEVRCAPTLVIGSVSLPTQNTCNFIQQMESSICTFLDESARAIPRVAATGSEEPAAGADLVDVFPVLFSFFVGIYVRRHAARLRCRVLLATWCHII